MSIVPGFETESNIEPDYAFLPTAGAAPPADPWMGELHALLQELECISAANETLPPVFGAEIDNQLVQVRLGMAGSLFAALQCKHAATAGHSLRVALTCSAWSQQMGLPPDVRDVVEVAALLHDIGVIGAPDSVLLKPGKLDEKEMVLMNRARRSGMEILKHSCALPEVLAAVGHVSAWYDGRLPEFELRTEQIPLGARMIALVEAYDSMTTDHVFRPARSREYALNELFRFAGTQFDPDLVKRFAEFQRLDSGPLHREVAGRWLRLLDPDLVNSYWELNNVPSPSGEKYGSIFEAKLLENMYDAVVFFDSAGRIELWNRGAERLTGISGGSVRGRLWEPEMLLLADEKGTPIHDADCPVFAALHSGVQSLRRLTMVGRTGRPNAVDTHAIPVAGEDGVMRGAILLFHDATSETSLEQRCQTLYDKSTKDPLTQVANRAEFDRVHEMFVEAHRLQGVPCGLMICDLDLFKQVNDVYGHQAGDDAIKSVAALLKSNCRPGDLVARYGGEEFVMLFADCDNATAARRSEQIRKALSQIAQPRLEGRAVTASFGVTEIQPGDTAETMLRRADRALLMAKGKGRNCVVQLGSGSNASSAAGSPPAGRKGTRAKDDILLEKTLVTPVPIKMAIEKLRGFVADHQAKIASIEGNGVCLEIGETNSGRLRRSADRAISFAVELTFEEQRRRRKEDASDATGAARTKIRVCIQPQKIRDRRQEEISLRAREVFVSLRSYMMAVEEEDSPAENTFVRVGRILAPWLLKK
ncbi:MAG: diguanylate cyclase [Pirellulales bacterium]|nr:diguanylate cyclase [Pirellulales bacterium]